MKVNYRIENLHTLEVFEFSLKVMENAHISRLQSIGKSVALDREYIKPDDLIRITVSLEPKEMVVCLA